ncbi:MAB_1171c family putative transporter [Streptomyces glaucescens]|uniref:Integral membrane protein n=1 Tax=Streptomyces glaucescens TaxID=1907 RepID=A0A089X4Z3_STRGA|nr:MAB_1171c family putative transporter [Streptomyces glaucescens]AIR98238.1 integral membrane protein [Streptomyces glaucescens]
MSLVVFVGAAALALAAVVLFRRPGTVDRNPLTVSTCVAVSLGALVLCCSAPVTLAAVNDLTGVPNFGAPLTYGMLSAYSCSLLILLVYWRGGPRERVRRMVRFSIAAYGPLIVAIVVLFVLADARTERLTDLDTYYANTPYMREMIVLYLVGHTAAMVAMCVVCLKWGREVTGLLRAGLRLIMIGALLDLLGFQLTKYTAVVARWTGHDLDGLSTNVAPPMASLAALVCSVGFVLPRLLPAAVAHWCGLRDYCRLGPLWSRVSFVATAPKPPAAWWQPPLERLHRREVAIHDALLALAPYFDDRVRRTALSAALDSGRTPHEARVTAEAAMLDAAARRAAARQAPLPAPSGHRLHATEVSGPGALVELAQALARTPAANTAGEGTVKAFQD